MKHPEQRAKAVGILRSLSAFRLPVALETHVDAILGLDDFSPPPRAVRRQMSAGIGCDFKGEIIDPFVISTQYGIPNHTQVQRPLGDGSWSQGVAAFEQAEFKQTDVDAFDKAYDLLDTTVKVKGPNNGGYFGEASLDTQYITAFGSGAETWFLAQDQFDMHAWCELVTAMPEVN